MAINASQFRDVGGLRTTNAGFLRKNRLFRSCQPADMGRAVLHYVTSDVGLQSIIDLRTRSEIIRFGSFPDDFLVSRNYVNLSLPSLELDEYDRLRMASTHWGHFFFYRYIITFEQGHIKKLFEIVAEPTNHPVLVHCISGKDRTGVMIALILMALGVRKEEVIHDYLRTESAEKVYIELLFDLIRDRGGIHCFLSSMGIFHDQIVNMREMFME